MTLGGCYPRIMALLLALPLVGCADWITDIPAYGSITVEAQRLDGDPVPDAPVLVYIGARPMAYGLTGADGLTAFRFLPKNAYGVYADPPEGYVRPETLLGGRTTAYIDGLALDEGEHRTVSFTYLKVGDGSVTVAVTEPDGTPIEGVRTELFDPHSVVSIDTTDASGLARFQDVPFGVWGVRARSPQGYFDTLAVEEYQDRILVEDGTDEQVGLHFERCEGTIRASVRDGAGAPVVGYPLEVFDGSGSTTEGLTADDGVGVFPRTSCGEYGVRLRVLPPWEFIEGRGTSFVDGLRLHRGGERSVSFVVTRCVGSIRVRVEDQGGTAISGAGLVLYNAEGALAEGASDVRGEHIFDHVGCAQEVGVKVEPPPGYSVEQERGSSYFDGLMVEAGEEAVITFRLTAE